MTLRGEIRPLADQEATVINAFDGLAVGVCDIDGETPGLALAIVTDEDLAGAAARFVTGRVGRAPDTVIALRWDEVPRDTSGAVEVSALTERLRVAAGPDAAQTDVLRVLAARLAETVPAVAARLATDRAADAAHAQTGTPPRRRPETLRPLPDDAKTFVLCVGSQKGGTSWLHSYLAQHPNVDLGFAKEYHVFDALYLPESDNFASGPEIARRYAEAKRDRSPDRDEHGLKRLQMMRRPEGRSGYFRYFGGLAAQSDSILLTGDITPGYAPLPVPALERIRDGIAGRGLQVKVLFLMRDPVDRILSASMMRWRRTSGIAPGDAAFLPPPEYVAAFAGWTRCTSRTRYEQTLQRLEAVFRPEDIHYNFYEALFAEDTMRSITAHLGIPYREPDFNERVMAAPERLELGDDLQRRLFDEYRPTYDAVADRFGPEALRTVWATYRDFADEG